MTDYYDYLVIGAGLFGSVFAHEAKTAGKRVLVAERRGHVGGNVYTEDMGGIVTHRYGAHIFHTSDKEVWDYIRRFSSFNNFINSPLAKYGGELYNLPFNMNTFSKMWGIATPNEARAIIAKQRAEITGEPRNLEEQAISLVGRDIYEKLIKGYTEKQWGRPCDRLPAFIIKRLPVRFVYDNNYFDDCFQGIPIDGYTPIIEKMLDGVDVLLNTDHAEIKERISARRTIYTGSVDEYFNYRFGRLGYRTLRFETVDMKDTGNYQGNAVINYTDARVPYTRVIEHKHFACGRTDAQNQPHTVVTWEYPDEIKPYGEPYYPIKDKTNGALFQKYDELAKQEKKTAFGGRLGKYQYYDMDDTIRAALDCADEELKKL